MESLSLEEESIIKDIRNLFRLKKGTNDTAIKDRHSNAECLVAIQYLRKYIYISEEATEMAAKYIENNKNVFLIILKNNRTLLQ